MVSHCAQMLLSRSHSYANRRAELEAELTAEQLRNATFVPAEVVKQLIETNSFGDRWPSSGLITIMHMIQEANLQKVL